VPPEGLGDQQLRPDAVGAGDEEGLAVATRIEGEEPPEATQATDDLGTSGGGDALADEIDGPPAGFDVDAGPGVGLVRWFQLRWPPTTGGCSSMCLVTATCSGTGIGYSEEKHAVQNFSPGTSVASTMPSRER
jgi:hypothetical protein